MLIRLGAQAVSLIEGLAIWIKPVASRQMLFHDKNLLRSKEYFNNKTGQDRPSESLNLHLGHLVYSYQHHGRPGAGLVPLFAPKGTVHIPSASSSFICPVPSCCTFFCSLSPFSIPASSQTTFLPSAGF